MFNKKINFLDQDLYKLIMGEFIWRYYRDIKCEFTIYNKNKVIDGIEDTFTADSKIVHDLNAFDFKPINNKERQYLIESIGLCPSYVYFLSNLVKDNFLNLRNDWASVTFLEIFTLSQLNEKIHKNIPNLETEVYKKGIEEISKFVIDFRPLEFGTRRRLSKKHQFRILNELKKRRLIVSSSNVLWSYQNNRLPFGTIAHELYMAQKSLAPNNLYGFIEGWIEFIKQKNIDYGTNYKVILLTDTWTTDHFIKNFDSDLLSGVDGFRHDSGCPFEWTKKMINYLEKNKIPNKTKSYTFIYSNCIDPVIAEDINIYFNKIAFEKETYNNYSTRFASGTYLMNNYFGVLPFKSPQFTMKLSEVNGIPVNKISDDPQKST